MLTSWLWIHTPDRHRGVDVVCSNRSLGLESTSSVVNERLPIPQVHQHKKGKITLTTAENSSGEVQKIDHAPTCLLVDRSTSSTFPPACWSLPRFQASFSRQLNSSEIYVFCWFEWSPWIVPGNRKKVHWGEEESLKWPRISALGSSGEEKRRSIEMIVHDTYASWRDVRLRRVTKTKWRNCREPPWAHKNSSTGY